jgi:hypothetical protein
VRKFFALGITAAATATAILGLAVPAQAATNWNLTGSSADMVGVWGWGAVGTRSDGRWEVTANVKDTASDSHGARVELWTVYDCGWGGERNEEVSASGYNATNSDTWNYDGDTVTMIAAREVLTEKGENWDWGGWVTLVGGPC